MRYFDFTVKQVWQPETVDYPGYGAIPYCWLNPKVDCEAAQIKSRYSFKKVDEARVADYVPLNYDDKMMTKFGFFRTERIALMRLRLERDSSVIATSTELSPSPCGTRACSGFSESIQ